MPWYDLLRHNFADFLICVLRLTDSHYGPPVWQNGIIVYSNSLGGLWGAYSNTLGSQIPVTIMHATHCSGLRRVSTRSNSGPRVVLAQVF